MLLVSSHSPLPHLYTSAAASEHSDRAISSSGMATSPSFSLQGSPAPPKPAPKPPLFNMPPNPRQSRRPKLSLQTAAVPRTFGKSTTSLTLNIPSDAPVSPTARNTFCNAYSSLRRDDASAVIVSSSSLSSASTTSSSSSSSLSSFSSTANVQSPSLSLCGGTEAAEVPYKLPRSARSILRNSPLGHARRSGHLRDSCSLKNAYPAATTTTTIRKPLFTPKKQVRYRTPLYEEIETVEYIAKHSDLYIEADSDSSDVSAFSSPEAGSDEDSQSDAKVEESEDEDQGFKAQTSSKKGLATAQSRSTSSFASLSRKKKTQKWRWTLGPVVDGHVLPGPVTENSDDQSQHNEPTTPITPTWTPFASDVTMSDRPDAQNPESDDDMSSVRMPAIKRRQTGFEYDGEDVRMVE
ncbi:hypothetical protein AAP_00988 [Ascosphaera apis ARSEF 7405]|uniref:Uncharacterized protein n=1 Tax=Ascosphaera apis ARSEF 7405 TaxID=392613 RepID=A0A168C6T1_9EURO|nr:hypothetical protein AAP_00988 [Ascosphaera apis ARSEF 7405]